MCCIETTPVIRTERLHLRAPRAKDADRIAQLANDRGVLRMTSSMPDPYGVEDARGFLDQIAGHDPSRERVFAIDHPEDGLIGMIGFAPSELGCELGYWLGRPYWGKGFATETARAALGWATDVWKRKVVVSGHFADNPKSGQVLIKTGFLYTGVVKRLYSRARGEDAPTRMMVWLA